MTPRRYRDIAQRRTPRASLSEKLAVCYDVVERHEAETGKAFDFVWRLRADMLVIVSPTTLPVALVSMREVAACIEPVGVAGKTMNEHFNICSRRAAEKYFSTPFRDYEKCDGDLRDVAGYRWDQPGFLQSPLASVLRRFDVELRPFPFYYTLLRPGESCLAVDECGRLGSGHIHGATEQCLRDIHRAEYDRAKVECEGLRREICGTVGRR